MLELKEKIRDVPDFPKPGIIFKDITTLLYDADAFRQAVDTLSSHYAGQRIDKVACMEARGFIFGAPLAYQLGAGLAIIRKPGKLPYKTHQMTYELEYGTDTLEIHQDAILPGQRVLIVDDLLATGGTTWAVTELVKKLQGNIAGIAFLIELTFLNGRDRLKDYELFSLIKY
jgi:adenine phosphoribosyltransferase